MVSAATLSSLRSVALSRPTRICGGTAHTNCGEGDVRLLSGNVRGRVAIVNSKDAVILRGDTTKELQLHSIGSGPGEWRAIGAIAVRVNGEILIYDPVLQRLTQYAPDGVVARSVVVSRPPGYNSARISANSLFILTWHGEDQPDIAIHQYDLATGKALGKVIVASNTTHTTGETDLRPIAPFFTPRPFWDVTSDGVVVLSYTDDAVVEWLTVKGRITSARLAIVGEPVTKADIERERKRLLPPNLPPAMEATVQPQVDAAARRARRVHQTVRAIVAAADGGVWVATHASGDASDTWYRFNSEGAPEGRLTMPPADRLIWADSQRIATLTTDSKSESLLTIWSRRGPPLRRLLQGSATVRAIVKMITAR